MGYFGEVYKRSGGNMKMSFLNRLRGAGKWMAVALTLAVLAAIVWLVVHFVLVPVIRDMEEDAVGHVYDFIVVGGGTSGSVVAARLSEEPLISVLLLEAGGDGGSLISDVPMLNTLLFNGGMDWGYRTRPDGKSCLGMEGGECLWHRGKVIGGTSVINAIIYNRGHRDDYDFWESRGNYGWSFEELLPYFKKSEDFRDRVSERDSAFHGKGGPLTVERARGPSILSELFFEAAGALGVPVTEDFSGEGQAMGVGLRHQTSRSGRRVSSANSFLAGAKNRTNLTILLGVQAQKILLEKHRAKGVLVRQRNGRTRRFMAKREVILSAGAVASPQLLMLSGIGPREHLDEVGVGDVVVDLPVGKNLQCHYGHSEPTFLIDKSVAPNPLFNALNPFNFLSYISHGSGPLRTAAGLEAVGFYRTGLHNESWPDVQVLMVSGHFGSDGGVSSARNFNLNKVQVARYKSIAFESGFTVSSNLLHPKSRGRIRLRSRNPGDHPSIEPNYFSHPDDVKTIVHAVRFAKAWGEGEPLKRHGSKMFDVANPQCGHLHPFSDAYWECAARHITHNFDHDVGTCRMGPPSDPKAVVDPELRVYGVPNLRVADASVMPENISGNTYAPCVMIGEVAADLVKRDHGFSHGLKRRSGIAQHILQRLERGPKKM